uniref:NADH dehydrogenase subunit 6 n=1 Tax=Acanthosepion aculeatum TaxID=3248847 RepID=V5N4J0_9MOLL|nr:NADH dehydrogenase subunit 6 [Sepia aculeata]AHA82376.1 NADH dehydrogenase subunit 6 [Sepia aculeata]
MSLLVLASFSFSLGSLCLMVVQPLSLGFMLMLNVMCIGALMGLLVFSWYGYVLFLIYVGGMLVMFMYIISLVPNLIFLSSKVMMYTFIIYFSYFLVNYVFMKEFIMESVKDNMMTNYSAISCMSSDMILMFDNFFCYVLLGVVLLFVLISVVKICYYCEGPLRVFKFKYA